MANTTISPNMNLIVPTVGVDPGPDWANNLNADLTSTDQHNHSPGQGVQINPNGININTDLPFNNNNGTLFRSVRFAPQGSAISNPADIGALYELGVDLYYIDGNGNQVRITQTGSVVGSAGTITGLPSGTASASYAAGTFTFQSATNTPAAMNVGPVSIGNSTAGSFNVTIAPNSGIAANYTLTLPAAPPASQGYLQMDATGNVSVLPNQELASSNIGPNYWVKTDGSNILTNDASATSAVLANDNSGNAITIPVFSLSNIVIQLGSVQLQGVTSGGQTLSFNVTNADDYIWTAQASGSTSQPPVGLYVPGGTSVNVVCSSTFTGGYNMTLFGFRFR